LEAAAIVALKLERAAMSQRVLFLCTGNYYRSRFAEVLFNHLAEANELDWHAQSRGLQIGWPGNVGPMSMHTKQRLAEMGVDCSRFMTMPMQLAEADLEAAVMVIAVKEAEHRAMMKSQFPAWETRVKYWHVHDLDGATPEQALREIEELVRTLVNELKLKRQT
jgi:protein-tyrosine phosphatase